MKSDISKLQGEIRKRSNLISQLESNSARYKERASFGWELLAPYYNELLSSCKTYINSLAKEQKLAKIQIKQAVNK